MSDWKDQLILKKERTAMPIMTHPGIDLIGKRVIDAVTDGRIQFEAIRAIADRYQAMGATMIMDLTVEAEAFGSDINFSDNEVPSVSKRLVSDSNSVVNLKLPGLRAGRIPEYIRASKLAAENIHNKPVFGGCIGPFSLAGRLYDMTEIMTAAYLEPDTILGLLEKCTAFLSQYIAEMKKTGINGIIMAEPAAGLLDESLCDSFSSVFVKQMVDLFQDDHFLFILHNCGNTGQVTRSMVSTGAKGLHFGNRIDIKRVLMEVPSDVLVFGNLDPVGAFKMSTPAEMKRLVAILMETTREFPNFVLSSGCDIPPGVTAENILAFYQALDEFNTKNKS
jgi:uroporphyrinogen decarboxylase